jgi:hypothetical protein
LPALAFDLGTKNSFDNPPPASLVYPAREEADLTGKESLEFQWSDDYPTETEGYEFKLYKGYNMTGANLIFQQDLSSSASSLKLNSDKFENGQAYTWSIKRVANCGRKSDPAYNSFKVKK